MHEGPRRSARTLTLTFLLLSASLSAQSNAQSSSPVVRMLLGAPDARTRAQAAMTLARLRTPEARPALASALSDRAAVVRAAAAAGLADVGDASCLAALRERSGDADANVRDAVARAIARLDPSAAGAAERAPAPVDLASARLVVTPGAFVDHTRANAHHMELLQQSVRDTLVTREGIAAPEGALPASVRARARRGAVRIYSLEGGLQRLALTEGSVPSVRAEVNLVIVAQPAHAIVGMVSGAGTARGPVTTPEQRRVVERAAIEGAVRGALQGLARNLDGAVR